MKKLDECGKVDHRIDLARYKDLIQRDRIANISPDTGDFLASDRKQTVQNYSGPLFPDNSLRWCPQ